jgi:hypothetical protein
VLGAAVAFGVWRIARHKRTTTAHTEAGS